MKCQDCQLACYDLLDRRLCAKDEREVLAHIEGCPGCRAFLEAEGERMRAWPRLLSLATRNAALPPDAAERVAHALEVSRGKGLLNEGAAWRPRQGFRRAGRWLALAASVLVLASLGVTAARMRERLGAAAGRAEERAVPAVRLVDQKNVKGLDVPEALPGVLGLESGSVVVRLETGVELTLVGPAKVDVRDGMHVYLGEGQLLANVPHWATGFTVRTRELEVYDLGTVFCVQVNERASDVFVLKGSVQVNEAGSWGLDHEVSGAGVGVCVAGEGVRTLKGEVPERFETSGERARRLFAEIGGDSPRLCPRRVFAAAQEIGDLWEERYRLRAKLVAEEKPKGKGPQASRQTAGAPATNTNGAVSLVAPTGMASAGLAAEDLFYSSSGGRFAWDAATNWFIYGARGLVGRLPNGNDTVAINAATLAAENGGALVVGGGVRAECLSFASGYLNYPGTACLRLEGGSLTSRTATVIGLNYPGLAVLQSGSLFCGTDLFIGGYGPGGRGVVTNTGAAVSALRLHVGHEAGTFGRLVHRGGKLNCRPADKRSSLQVGFNGGVGEFEAAADFGVYVMGIGNRTTSADPLGMGSVTVAAGATGVVNHLLRIRNGNLFMRGGTIRLENASATPTNLFVRQDADGAARIRGWGRFACSGADKTLRMINNGVIAADGEGQERDLDFTRIAVVNHDLLDGADGTNGWYAVNRGRVLYPRTRLVFPAARSVPCCVGDLFSKTVPELVNSVGLTLAVDTPAICYLRGGFCASDRRDIPAGLPDNLRPIGFWCVGVYGDKAALSKASFSGVSLTFRYDHAKLKPTDSGVLLFRHDGRDWVKVGESAPDSGRLISTETPLPELASGDYNIGWFAVLAAERKGTVLSIN